MTRTPTPSARPCVSTPSAIVAVLALGACSGGGGASTTSGVAPTPEVLVLDSVSIAPGSVVRLNEPWRFTFSRAVDLNSVGAATLRLRDPAGGVVIGDYRHAVDVVNPADPCSPSVVREDVVVFQPACPLAAGGSGSGLAADGGTYSLEVLGSDTSPVTVRGTDGAVLSATTSFSFVTPVDPGEAYVDPFPSAPPSLRLSPLPCSDVFVRSRLELGGDPNRLEPFAAYAAVPVPASGAMPLSLLFRGPLHLLDAPDTRVDVVLEFEGPLDPTTVNADTIRLDTYPLVAIGDFAVARVPATVTLESNCGDVGARVRVRPIGALPQDHRVEVRIEPGLRDLAGQGAGTARIACAFLTGVAIDPLTGLPSEGIDAIRETFANGATVLGSHEDVTTPLAVPRARWGGGRLVAARAPVSQALSTWFPIGFVNRIPASTSTEDVDWRFHATDVITGYVRKVAGNVPPAVPILTTFLASPGGLPRIEGDLRTIEVDATTIVDDTYVRSPGLLEGAELKLLGPALRTFVVESARLDPVQRRLHVTVAGGVGPLAEMALAPTAWTMQLAPRFVGVREAGVAHRLAHADVRIEFQGAPILPDGTPNLAAASAWSRDVSTWRGAQTPGCRNFRFVRFRVTFERDATSLAGTGPDAGPSLEFLNLPFRF